MKLIKRLLIGCAGIFVLGLLILAVVAGAMITMGPPESREEESRDETPVATDRLTPLPDPAPGEVPLPPAILPVLIDLEEGKFDIRPGQPGEGIRVDAKYDAGVYSLEQKMEGGKATIRFRSKYTILRRLLTIGAVEPENHVTIYLPPDVALALDVRISKGESDIDLSGLAVASLDADLRMGEHALRADEPNTLGMEKLNLKTSMGEFRTSGLGNLRFGHAQIDGSMGELQVDLQGAYVADASAHVHLSMGELRIIAPANVNLDLSKRVMMGEVTDRTGRGDPGELPGAPTLALASSVTMGELRVERR